MRVLVCDDHGEAASAIGRISRECLADGGGEIVIAGHPRTAKAAFRDIAATRFDVALIDLYLPVQSSKAPPPPAGPWLARAIKRAYPKLRAPLVMWTNNVDSTLDGRNQSRAFRHHGGQHIIDKVRSPGDQLRTLLAALAGETWEPPEDCLTKTEREIIAYYAAGHSRREIAGVTYRSLSVIEGHITAIRQKLLPVPTPREIGSGAAAVIAAAAADRHISWLPIDHLAEPVGVLALIDQG